MKGYKCKDCGLLYKDKRLAEDCEAWCLKHKSCNMEITKHAINKKEVANEKI